jgi:betaine reductase
VHGGYDPTYANEDPNRVLPLDAVRTLVRERRIGSLSETYYATVGNATSVERARRYGEEIAALLINEGVQAVVFTSTWGTCTRCGATMVKELERAGLPTVHVCSIVPISITVGANRIVPSVAIPHPLGDPALSSDEEFAIRKQLVERALDALQTDTEEQRVFD